MLVVKRYQKNPIVWPNRANAWEAEAAFNGCAIESGSRVHLVYRAEAASQRVGDADVKLSSIGYAVSRNGTQFTGRRQLIQPEYDWERYGCEDPRLTKFGNKHYIFYTALSTFPFSPDGIKVGLAVTRDFHQIEKHPVTPFNAKAMALFPRPVGGKMAAILTANTDRPPSKIAIALFDKEEDIWSADYWHDWYAHLDEHVVPLLRSPNDHVELGAPPVLTKHGWLIIYSYIRNYFSGRKIFGIEAALLDRDDPRKIVHRTDRPFLVPEEEYELYGRVPNIVLLALYVVAIVAFIFAGYANGLQARRVRLPVYVMGVLVSTVILLIQDLDRPNTGFINVSQQPMIDVAASIAAYAK